MTRGGKYFAQGGDGGGGSDPLDPDAAIDPNADNSAATSGDLNMLWLLLLLALLLLAGFVAYKRRQATAEQAKKLADLSDVVQMDDFSSSDHGATVAALQRHAAPKPIRVFRGSVTSVDGHSRGGAQGNAIYGDLVNSDNTFRQGALGNATYGGIAGGADDDGTRVVANQTYQTMEPADDGPRTIGNSTYVAAEVEVDAPFPGMASEQPLYADGMPRVMTGEEPEYGSLNPAMSDAEYAVVTGVAVAETSIDLASRGSSTAWGMNPRLMAGMRTGSYQDAMTTPYTQPHFNDDEDTYAAGVADEDDTYGVVQPLKYGSSAFPASSSSGSVDPVNSSTSTTTAPRMTHYNMAGEDLYQSNASVRGQSSRSLSAAGAPADENNHYDMQVPGKKSKRSAAGVHAARGGTVMPSPPIIYMVAKNGHGGVGQILKCEYIPDEGGYVDMESGDLFVTKAEEEAAATAATMPSQEYVASFSVPRDMEAETFLLFLPGQGKNNPGGLPLVQTTMAAPTDFVRVPTNTRASRASLLLPFEAKRFSSTGSAKSSSSGSRKGTGGFFSRFSSDGDGSSGGGGDGRGSDGDGGNDVSPLSVRVMSVRRTNPLHNPEIDYSADPTAVHTALSPVPASPAYATVDAVAPSPSTQSNNDRAFFPENLVIEDDQPGFYSSHHGDTMHMDVPLSPSFLPGQARPGRRHSGTIPMRSSSTVSYGADVAPLTADEEARTIKRTHSSTSMLAAV